MGEVSGDHIQRRGTIKTLHKTWKNRDITSV